MTLANPIVVTENAVATDLPKINLDNYGSEYRANVSGGQLSLKIRHQSIAQTKGGKKQDRHVVDLTHTVFAVDPAPQRIRRAYLVIQHDYDDDLTGVSYLSQALVDLMTDAHIADVLSWQS